MRIPAGLLLLALPLAFPAAAPLDAATQQDLVAVLHNYDKAIVAGKLDAAFAVMSAELREHARSVTKTEKERREAIAMARMMVPDSISVVHSFIDKTATHARLVTVATKTMPKGRKLPDAPPPGSTVRTGVTVGFVTESGAWRLDSMGFGPDPTVIKGCKDETADPASAYDDNRTVSAGGPVIRVDFQPGYTLVVLTVVDEATCAFLPPREALAEQGIDPAQLVPYAIVSLDGIAHRTDPQKMRADSVEVHPEE